MWHREQTSLPLNMLAWSKAIKWNFNLKERESIYFIICKEKFLILKEYKNSTKYNNFKDIDLLYHNKHINIYFHVY